VKIDDFNQLLPEIQAMVDHESNDIVGQCLNFSIDRSRYLESFLERRFPQLTVASEIAIGNYGLAQIGTDMSFCFPRWQAEAQANNPELAIQHAALCHAWNVIDGIIVDLTVMKSMNALGAPVKAKVICSEENILRLDGFNLGWSAYKTYPAKEMRRLKARYWEKTRFS
jgi:hypothetical protein